MISEKDCVEETTATSKKKKNIKITVKIRKIFFSFL